MAGSGHSILFEEEEEEEEERRAGKRKGSAFTAQLNNQ
jgi:hypothetical protein